MKRNVLYVFLLYFGVIHQHSMLGSAEILKMITNLYFDASAQIVITQIN